MTKEKVIPQVRFSGFTDTWEQREFKNITFPSGIKNKENLPYESYSVTNESGFIPQNEQFENGGTMATADKTMYYIVTPSSFAYNPARINVGSIGYYNGSENVIVSSLYEVFQTTDEINDRFLWHWFKNEKFQKLIEQYQEGGVRLYFYYDKLCMGSISTPKVEEQRRIGAYFDDLDRLITLHQRKYDKLTKVKKAMLEKMFPENGSPYPEIRFKGFTDAWEQREVSNVAMISTGGTPSTAINEYWNPKQVPWLSSGEVHKKYITYTDDKISNEGLNHSSARMIKQNSVLIALAGQGKTRGTVAINRISLSTNQSIAAMTFAPDICPEFVFSNLESRYDELRKVSSGDGTRGGLNKQLVSEIQIPYTSLNEQRKIGQFFTHLDRLITLHQRKLEKLKNIKKACLEKMFV